MKLLAAIAAIVLTACASSPSAPARKVQIPEPEFEIRQLVGPAQLTFEEGDIEVKFALDIGNRASMPITLRRLEIVTVNPAGGAYTLDPGHRAYYFNKTVNPLQSGHVEFWAKASGYGRSIRDSEPVTVRGTLYYETPDGYYNQVFIREIGQYPGQND